MPDADSEFSVLLWALGALVAGLALHLGQGWTRMAQRSSPLRQGWRALLLASAVLGLGLTSALVLGMQAQPLYFPVGYRWLALAVLVPSAVVVCLPAVWVAAAGAGKAYGNVLLLAAGALLAAAALGLQVGWVWAAGFRPGVAWHVELVAAAAVLLVVGLALAQWMALAPVIQDSARRSVWRAAAATLGALTLMVGQQLMSVAGGLEAQTLSSYSRELPGAVLSLVCSVLVPLALVALMLDLWLRRKQLRRRSHGGFKPKPRNKRRYKVHSL